MNLLIEIHYKAESRLRQSGSFLLRGKKPEEVALEFWKQIQKEMSYHVVLEKVILNGENDITEQVKELEEQEFRRKFAESEDLPF